MTTDADLVGAANGGDRRALDDLLRRHHDRVWAVCRRIVGNDADAADATQEALISIVRGLDRFDGRAAFSTWAYRIATNAALDELRRRQRRPLLSGGTGEVDGPQGGPGGPRVIGDPRATQAIDAVGERNRLEAALATLPEEFRVAVVLRDVADLDYAEISQVLDIPPGTVRSRIARGRAVLARALGEDDTGNPQPSPQRHIPRTNASP